MSANMTPSTTTPNITTKPITNGEIGKMNDSLAARCRKNKASLPSKIVQDVLKEEGNELAQEQFEALRRRVEKRTRSWHEENGVIYFSVTSDGSTGEQWIAKLEVNGKFIGRYGKQLLLRSDKFVPTNGVTYNVAVLKGELFSDSDRYTSNIRDEAKLRKFATPPVELACLIRDKFKDAEIEAMGLWWIVTFHDPIEDFVGRPSLLGADRDGFYTLGACYGNPVLKWPSEGGFAFLVSQVSS